MPVLQPHCCPTGPSGACIHLVGEPSPLDLLWADDNEGDRRLIQIALHETGARANVRFANDGRQLLDAVARRTPHLVVLDLKMPGMNGIEVLEQLRSRAATARLPVAIFTSSTNLEELTACYRFGASAIVHKPINHEAFTRAVARIATPPRERRLPEAHKAEGTARAAPLQAQA